MDCRLHRSRRQLSWPFDGPRGARPERLDLEQKSPRVLHGGTRVFLTMREVTSPFLAHFLRTTATIVRSTCKTVACLGVGALIICATPLTSATERWVVEPADEYRISITRSDGHRGWLISCGSYAGPAWYGKGVYYFVESPDFAKRDINLFTDGAGIGKWVLAMLNQAELPRPFDAADVWRPPLANFTQVWRKAEDEDVCASAAAAHEALAGKSGQNSVDADTREGLVGLPARLHEANFASGSGLEGLSVGDFLHILASDESNECRSWRPQVEVADGASVSYSVECQYPAETYVMFQISCCELGKARLDAYGEESAEPLSTGTVARLIGQELLAPEP